MFRKSPRQLRKSTRARSAGGTPSQLEPLEGRTYFSIHAIFLAGPGRLSVFGDILPNAITLSRNPAGGILVNGGAVRILGGTPTVANTKQIQINGSAGNDQVALDEANGALPKATLFGGSGNDILTGGSGADLLFGQGGNDALFGQGGADVLFGGSGADTLTGGADNDMTFGEAGNDHLLWNPGDATDMNEGGDGTDEVIVNGGSASESFTATPNGARVRFDRTDPAPFSLDVGTVETLTLNANAGDDAFAGSNGLATLIKLVVNGGVGDDTLAGSDGPDVLVGRDGNDTIDGNGGNDLVLLGDGDDVFTWDPGDGSDTVEGQNGNDAMVFNGSNLAEDIAIAANGSRARVSRDLGNIVMDVNGLERIDVNALGGADAVTVNDLSGTDVVAVNADLGPAGDGAADAVTVNGTDRDDTIGVKLAPLAVTGLHALVTVANAGSADSLAVSAGDGDDLVNAANPLALGVKLTENGGAGNDTLVGSRGDDTLVGGDGDDFFIGFRGSDTALMGAGDDTFEWDPGDGSDVVEGQGGRDTMLSIGSNDGEGFDLSANGNRARFLRTTANAANVTMDLNGVEHVDLSARGGADSVVVNDLSATDVTALDLDLDGGLGSGAGDNEPDTVVVNGTGGDDALQIASFDNGKRVAVAGLFPFLNVTAADADGDVLAVNTLGGNDAVDAANLLAGSLRLAVDGGAGDDLILGGTGRDVITGGPGNDTAFMGNADDIFIWNNGDGSDRVEGGAGADRMLFIGSDLPETFGLAANANRTRFTRDVGSVTMDLDDVERIDVRALGGADRVVANDLSGTDVNEINLNLTGTPAGTAGDGQVDTVVVNGTAAGDLIPVLGTDGAILVNGSFAEHAALPYFMVIRAVEPADVLQINGNGGDDTIDAGTLETPVTFRAEGRIGNDILLGSRRDDVLVGGDGDDAVDGNGGSDLAFLGAGEDTFVWDPGDGNDVVEGEGGADTLVFRGSNGGESINLTANGNRLRLFRTVGPITLDVDDIERVDVITLGGQDTVVVGDLAATDVVLVDVNLGANGSASGDLLADSVFVNGTAGADRIVVNQMAGALLVTKPTTAVRITGADPAIDSLAINALGGDDTVDATGMPAGSVELSVDGGDGNDTLLGSPGNDILAGGPGDDTLIGGAGDDILLGGPGLDTLDGGPGTNTVLQD